MEIGIGVLITLVVIYFIVEVGSQIQNDKNKEINDLGQRLKELSEDYWKKRIELESTKEKLIWNVKLAERYERDYLNMYNKYSDLFAMYKDLEMKYNSNKDNKNIEGDNNV